MACRSLAASAGLRVSALNGGGFGDHVTGVTTLAGSWITDPAGFKQALREGAPWGRFARKFVLEDRMAGADRQHPIAAGQPGLR